MKVKFDQLDTAINSLLKEYGDECSDIVDEEVDQISKECAKKVKANANAKFKKGRGSKHYANGWRTQIEKNRLKVTAVIYNATKPQLTHLLENGHATPDGTDKVPGRPHIAPVDEWASEELPRRVIERISK